ncbi:hypothetical protein CIB95_14235 [Lottiidibacillus patelloidae]|uniref:Uncharacterized protein n=1 Tax=Lottiidibacillus patelloidae TaxID=2670334 RepID=A0A263BQM0_9BACI|nr:hypothetical protein [Lottiidibacillus patelloidae]OZM56000.1 hypothetical protein CIB95_14235 [Lottiidibacillus patelloidae]
MKISTYINSPKIKTSIILAIILCSFFLFTSFNDGKEETISKFEEAIKNENVKALNDLLFSSEKDLSINEGTTKEILQYIKDNSLQDEIISAIKQEGKHDLFSLVKDTKLGLFENYVLVFHPYYMEVTYPEGLKKITIKNGKEIQINPNEKKTTIPVVPGIHIIKAFFETDYLSFTHSFQLDVSEVDANRIYKKYLKVGSVDIMPVWSDVTYYINGKEVKAEVGNNALTLNPIPLDGSVSIYYSKEFPWGTFQTEEFIISEGKPYHEWKTFAGIDPVNDTVAIQINESLIKFLNSWEEAIENHDLNIVKNITEEFNSNIEIFFNSIKRLNWKLVNFEIKNNPPQIFSNAKGKYSAVVSVKESYFSEREGITYYIDLSYVLRYDPDQNEWAIHERVEFQN